MSKDLMTVIVDRIRLGFHVDISPKNAWQMICYRGLHQFATVFHDDDLKLGRLPDHIPIVWPDGLIMNAYAQGGKDRLDLLLKAEPGSIFLNKSAEKRETWTVDCGKARLKLAYRKGENE